MRILIVDSSIAFTGAFKCSLAEAELLSTNHTFIFVLPVGSTVKKYLDEKNIKSYELPMIEISKSKSALMKYLPRLWRNAARLKKILKDEQIDVLQINDFYNMLGVMVKLRGFKKKLITYVRFLPSSRPAPLRKFWSYLGEKFSDKVIGVSKITIDQLPYKGKAVYIYDPVKLEENLPSKQYVEKDTVDILFQGNYIRGKGQDSGLEAFIIAYRQNPNIRLRFAGGDMGLEKNKEFKKQLEDRVAEEKLQDVVKFTAFTQAVEEGIKSADIVLNFSESESFSMTCLEASFYGTSLIATRCGGPEEIIIDGETGFLVPLHNHQAQAEAILKLANDAALRERFAIAAKKTVSERFPTSKFIAEFEQVLKDIS